MQKFFGLGGFGVVGGVASGAVKRVLALIEKTPGYRANAIAEISHLPLRSVQWYLSLLKKQGKIKFQGAPRNGGYYPL